jgi:hypothetical protein
MECSVDLLSRAKGQPKLLELLLTQQPGGIEIHLCLLELGQMSLQAKRRQQLLYGAHRI